MYTRIHSRLNLNRRGKLLDNAFRLLPESDLMRKHKLHLAALECFGILNSSANLNWSFNENQRLA